QGDWSSDVCSSDLQVLSLLESVTFIPDHLHLKVLSQFTESISVLLDWSQWASRVIASMPYEQRGLQVLGEVYRRPVVVEIRVLLRFSEVSFDEALEGGVGQPVHFLPIGDAHDCRAR